MAAQTVYFTITEWLWGQSLGKRLLHIKVVTEDQDSCSFMDSFTRNVVRLLDIIAFFYLFSLGMVIRSKKNQRIGDYIARTIVINVD